jgi:hypothetical protein
MTASAEPKILAAIARGETPRSGTVKTDRRWMDNATRAAIKSLVEDAGKVVADLPGVVEKVTRRRKSERRNYRASICQANVSEAELPIYLAFNEIVVAGARALGLTAEPVMRRDLRTRVWRLKIIIYWGHLQQ